jgi:hypothetical protein
MNDKPDGPRLNKIARLNQWSKAFPNARLAVLGLLLLLLTAGATFAVAALDNPVFDGNVYRDSPLHKDPPWQLLIPFIGISLEVAILAGITTMVFAAYRAIRNRLRRSGSNLVSSNTNSREPMSEKPRE